MESSDPQSVAGIWHFWKTVTLTTTPNTRTQLSCWFLIPPLKRVHDWNSGPVNHKLQNARKTAAALVLPQIYSVVTGCPRKLSICYRGVRLGFERRASQTFPAALHSLGMQILMQLCWGTLLGKRFSETLPWNCLQALGDCCLWCCVPR